MKKTFKVNIFFLILFCFIGIIISYCLGKDSNWDLANYHYYSAWALFNERIGYDIMPCGIQSYFNPLLDIPFYLLVKNFNSFPKLIMCIQSLYWGVSIFLVYIIAKNIFKFANSSFIIAFAVIIGASGIVSILEIGATFNDIQIAILILTSLLIFQKTLFSEESLKRIFFLVLAALILGIATGLKTSALFFSIAVFLSLICSYKKISNPYKTIIIIFLAFVAGYLITNGWWMYKLYSHFQNPFFPFYNDIFKSEYAFIEKYTDMRHFPKNIIQWIFFPFFWGGYNYSNVTIEFPNQDIRPMVLYICFFILFFGNFIVAKFIKPFKKELEKYITLDFVNFLILFLFFSYIIWLNTSATWRYLLPVDFLSGIFISIVLIYCKIFTKSTKITSIAGSVLLVVMLITTKYTPLNMTRLPFDNNKMIYASDLKLPDNAKVFIAGGFPTQFFIPFQNSKAQFIYLYGEINYPFIHPDERKNEIKKIINNPENEIFLIYSEFEPAPVNWEIVEEYIDRNELECEEQVSSFTMAKYFLCRKNQVKSL